MLALKGLVIAMGVLILAGMAVIVVTIANRAGGDAERAGSRAHSEATLEIPAGATVLGTALDGGRMALHLRLSDGSSAVHIHDLKDGKRVGRHRIAAERSETGVGHEDR